MSSGTLKTLFVLAVLFIVIHIGYKLIPMYMDYERMKDEMSIKASTAQVWKDDEIRTALVQKAKDLELPLGPENFLIKRDEDKHMMTISTQWDDEVHFLFDVYVRTFHFTITTDEDYTKAQR